MENENFAARALKIWIWTSKIMPDLWLSAVFCQTKKKSLHPTAGGRHSLTAHSDCTELNIVVSLLAYQSFLVQDLCLSYSTYKCYQSFYLFPYNFYLPDGGRSRRCRSNTSPPKIWPISRKELLQNLCKNLAKKHDYQ